MLSSNVVAEHRAMQMREVAKATVVREVATCAQSSTAQGGNENSMSRTP